MEIKFNGVVAETKRIKYAVKQNNNANVIVFKLSKNQERIILDPTKKFYIKIQSCAKTFFDKDPRAVITSDEDYIYVAWTMLRKHTQFKNIDVQIQYEVASQDIVWQTEIINVDLFSDIPADKEIENLYPSILTLMQEELDDHEARITALEQGGGYTISWGQITGDLDNQTDLKEKFDTLDLALDDLSNDIDRLDDAINDEEQSRINADQELQDQIDNIDVAWGNITGDIDDQLDLKEKLDEIREVAEGKTRTFVVDTDVEGNEVFKSDDVDIEVEQFTDIQGNVILTSSLKVGDAIFTKNTATKIYQDRWLSDVENNTWSILSADDPRLENYYTKTEIDSLLSLKANVSDLDNYVDLTSNQTITGQKTFSNGITINGTIKNTGGIDFNINNSSRLRLTTTSLQPSASNALSLGTSTRLFSSVFSSSITDVNGSYSSDNVFNVINANDIASDGTLTQAQYDLITNGKPTLIKGTFLEYDNPVLSDIISYNVNTFSGIISGNKTGFKQSVFSISKTTKKISISYISTSINYDNGWFTINRLENINEKLFPSYSKGALYYDGSNLSWNDSIGGGFEIDPEKYIIKQGTKFVQVDSIPSGYTGIGYMFSETGFQVYQFNGGEETGVMASVENDTIALTNGSAHSISMNSNTGKILVDGLEETLDFEMADGTTKSVSFVKNA